MDLTDTAAVLTTCAPAGPARGGVVVVHEAFGVTPYLVGVCKRLAAAGLVAVAPHLYHRDGDPVFAYDVDSGEGVDARVVQAEAAAAAAIGPHMMNLSADEILDDVDSALAMLRDRGFGPEQTVITGFCLGGTVTTFVAARRSLHAAVTFYGNGILQETFGIPPLADLISELRTPWLGFYGDRDAWIPTSDVDALVAATTGAPLPARVVRYPDAGHGFHCNLRTSYDGAAATDAWSGMLDWFDRPGT
jgi:carboxymethylenebutenolidase